MSEDSDASAAGDVFLRPFLAFWSGYLEQAAKIAKGTQEHIAGDTSPEAWRRQGLQAVSESVDAYLRSPVFLQLLKNHLDVLVATKRWTNELSKGVADRGPTGPSLDVAELREQMCDIEDQLLDQLARIEERLTAVEAKFKT